MGMLAAVIRGPTIGAALEEMRRARPFADLFELRLDRFESLKGIGKIADASPLPLIFTLRKGEQGGGRKMEEGERLKAIEELLDLGPSYLDIEADTDPEFIERIGNRFPDIQLIGSIHDFEKTPEDLNAILEGMKNRRFSIYKMAFFANSAIDLLRLMIFALEQGRTVPLTCLAMGEAGSPSRVLGPIVGNAIDYSSEQIEPSPLFHCDLKTLHERFRYRTLNRQTEIFALIGDPVNQSPGEVFHNAMFKKNALYVKLRLGKEELPLFWSLFRKLPFRGLSVTIPLKEAVIPFLDRIDAEAKAIGAVNTLTVIDGDVVGANTDAAGALNAIERHLEVKGKRVAILGAGGTARAIAQEAKPRGAAVEIYARTPERAKQFAGDRVHRLEEIGACPCDLLINTIPPPAGAPLAIDLPRAAVVMDVVYHPRETPLLKAARERGCLCIYGEEMFNEQARLQQDEWIKYR